MNPTVKRRLLWLACSAVLFGAVLYSSQVVTNASVWNWSRGFLVFVSGLCSLVLIWLLTIKDLVWSTKLLKAAKIVIGILFTPIIIIGSILVLFLSTCTFDGRHRENDIDEVKVGDSRVYIDYIGNQGALGASGLGVFQEKPWFGPFYRRKELCFVFGTYRNLKFRILDSVSIECTEGEENRVVPLPL